MTESNYYHLEVGLIYRGSIRGLLERLKFEQALEDFHESKAWLGSSFTVRGLTPTGRRYIDGLLRSIAEERAQRLAEHDRQKQADKEAGRVVAIWVGSIMGAIFLAIAAYAFYTS